MPIEPYSRIQLSRLPGESPESRIERLIDAINRIQDQAEQSARQYADTVAQPGNDYVVLTGVSLSTGSTNLISHKLGRSVQGYRVTRKTAAATIHDEIGSTSEDLTKFIPLVASASCTVDLEVF